MTDGDRRRPGPPRAADDPAYGHALRLVEAIAPGSRVTDLGGWISRNLAVQPAGLVLRIHQPEVSRARLLAVQRVRGRLAAAGLPVPAALSWRGRTTFRCGDRWVELEPYLAHERLEPTWTACHWMYAAMGTLHTALAALGDLAVPRPRMAFFVAPGTLRRWLVRTERAAAGDPGAAEPARLLREVVTELRRRWVPAARLPGQLVHGDVKPENFGRAPDGRAVYLDFGFVARRPRIHDLAFSLTHTVMTVDGNVPVDPARFPWSEVPRLVEAYEESAGRLGTLERRALTPYTVAARVYFAASAGYRGPRAGEWLRNNRPALELSRWLLAHPDSLTG